MDLNIILQLEVSEIEFGHFYFITFNACLSEDSELFSWGWNDHGMCGTGDTRNVTMPTKISLTSLTNSAHLIPLLVGAGAGHSIAVVTRKK